MNYILLYPISAMFYSLVIVFVSVFSFLASKVKGDNAKVFVILIISILTCVAGFRGITVGIDTIRYLEVIENIHSMIGTNRIKPMEFGYAYYVIFLTSIIKNSQIVLLVSALITNSLIVIRLWTFRNKISFSFAVFLYTTLYFIMTLNTMRQWIAIAIVFFSVIYLFEEKYLKFTLIVLLASTFHTSVLVSLILIPIFLVYKRKISIKSKKYFLLSIVFSPAIIMISFLFLRLTPAISQYEHYFRNPDFDFSISWFFRVTLILFLFIFINPKKNQEKYSSVNIIERNKITDIEFYKIMRLITAVGLMIRAIGLFYEYTARAGLYLSFFEIVLFSFVIKSRNYGQLIRILLITFSLLNIYLVMKDSGYGQIPYYPFWRNPIY